MNEASDLGEFAVIADRDGVSGKAKNFYNAYWSHYGILSSQRA
jgi:hypothetical protein